MRYQKLIFLVIVVFIVGGVLLFKQGVGDIRPALLPPSGKIRQVVEQRPGAPVGFGLNVVGGFEIGVFAGGIENARDLEFSPGGTLLVSSTKQGKVFALPDKDNDGRADEVKPVLLGLARPHGLVFWNGKLFVAEESRVVRYFWDEEKLEAKQDKVLFSLPGSQGGHFTRSIVFDKNGRMFVSVGSTCNVCNEKHEWLAAIVVSDAEGNNPRLFAEGLRNSVFMAVSSVTGQLWATEMGRDHLGDDLPPDEINIVQEGRDYGWPFCYGARVYDLNFSDRPYKETPCRATEAAAYEIAAHSAPLGLVFINSPQFPEEWQGNLLVSYHGSWNRSTPIGYKVVRLEVEGDKVVGEEDFITGFVSSNAEGGLLAGNQAHGRPVDLVFAKDGSLYVSDDKAGVVYKVVK